MYIVSLGFVVDGQSERLLGAVYGAGADAHLDQNRIFAAWLQKRVVFEDEDALALSQTNTTSTSSSSSFSTAKSEAKQRAMGPDAALLELAGGPRQGVFRVYDSDYQNMTHRGTLLHTSPLVMARPGDTWALLG